MKTRSNVEDSIFRTPKLMLDNKLFIYDENMQFYLSAQNDLKSSKKSK